MYQLSAYPNSWIKKVLLNRDHFRDQRFLEFKSQILTQKARFKKFEKFIPYLTEW